MNTAFWLGILLGAVASLIVAELADVSAWIAPKIVRRAGKSVSVEFRDRYVEEWAAELQAYDGLKLIKLSKAIHIWMNRRKLRMVLEGSSQRLPEYLRTIWIARKMVAPFDFLRAYAKGVGDPLPELLCSVYFHHTFLPFSGLIDLQGGPHLFRDNSIRIKPPVRGYILWIHDYPVRWCYQVRLFVLLCRCEPSIRGILRAYAWCKLPRARAVNLSDL
ncbi:hypothetical protein ABZ801_23235 [Actinomadura sp. NPDC047616]|uniref:hypothetical protein n=1 Tax=Actinomadura sp. NPDC047616 TaxID=3155914 RepID=UPI00340E9AAD